MSKPRDLALRLQGVLHGADPGLSDAELRAIEETIDFLEGIDDLPFDWPGDVGPEDLERLPNAMREPEDTDAE